MEDLAIPYVVENMAFADVPAVVALENIAFSLPWSIHAFEYEVRNNPMAHFLVVRRRAPVANGDTPPEEASRSLHPILGYGGLWLIVDEGHVCTLAVHPDWRGHGLGALLLSGLIEHCMTLGAAVATLEVRRSNLVAQSLYEKYGFAKVGLRKAYYADNHEDALIMTTDLLSSPAYQERLRALQVELLRRLAGAS
jgi:ribosomal-protein-alanine N-acetyltransferase